jgi:SnoaL-like domain
VGGAFQAARAAVLAAGLWLTAAQAVPAADSAGMQARLDRLEIDVVRAEDISAIKKLQRAYGFYADRGLWEDLGDLFADDATADYPSGIFIGKKSIRDMFLENLGGGRLGLADGRLYNHTILQPVVDLDPAGDAAKGRWRVLAMLGGYGQLAIWGDGLYRFDYVKRDGVWKIAAMVYYSGAGSGLYGEGWATPKPRPPGAPDPSKLITQNLAHPADQPRNQPCDADPTGCVAPFHYPDPGVARSATALSAVGLQPSAASTPAQIAARLTDLARRARRLQAEKAVENLQHAYGYYLDRGLWRQAADLFAKDGSLEIGQSGVYVGREHIRRSLALTGPAGLRQGQLNDHLQIEPIIDVAADGLSAQGRVFELALVGGPGGGGKLVQGVEENQYVRRGGVWMIQRVQDHTTLVTDYDKGWAKDAEPAPPASRVFPPDRPPTEVYEAYPQVHTPRFHFDNPVTGKATQYADGPRAAPAVTPAVTPAARPTAADLEAATAEAVREIRRVQDYDEIENLQNAYGYYLDKSLWDDVAGLFARDGSMEVDQAGVYVGRERIRAFLQASGPQGPIKGLLDNQLQLQPLIDVAPDGTTARIRSRLLQQSRDSDGAAVWSGGIYENELVKEDGIWKFSRLHLYRTFTAKYVGGWARAPVATLQGISAANPPDRPPSEIYAPFPQQHTPPFHYRNPVTNK